MLRYRRERRVGWQATAPTGDTLSKMGNSKAQTKKSLGRLKGRLQPRMAAPQGLAHAGDAGFEVVAIVDEAEALVDADGAVIAGVDVESDRADALVQ
jgi:hypothetical protein